MTKKKFTDDEKAAYRAGFRDCKRTRENKLQTAQIIIQHGLKQVNLSTLLEILLQYTRQDERRSSGRTRRNIKKILEEIVHRMGLPKDIADSIIERDS